MAEAKAIAPLEFEKPLVEFEKRLDELRKLTGKQKIEAGTEITSLEKKLEEARRDIYGKLSPWQRVQIVRHPQRPYRDWETDRKSTRLNSSHSAKSRMPSSA